MYLKRYFDEEVWKQVDLKTPFNEKYILFVSNYGNLKKISLKNSAESIVKQSLTEGYPSFNLSYCYEIPAADVQYFTEIRKHITSLKKEIKHLNVELLKCDGKNAAYYDILKKIDTNESLLETITTNYKIKYQKSENNRKTTYGSLTHRLVAMCFVEKPSENHTFVAHLDFDKLNNHHSNLKWMTQKENTAHQQNSPHVIKAKALAIRPVRITRAKLTVNQVMILKKRINEGKPLSKLAKRFKVSETQLLRIKRGINWANIPAAR